MARPLRIEFPGALYHVTSRGDAREAIYRSDADRHAWLDILAETCRRFQWRSHGWCQMTNHYHLVVETAEGNLSRGMRQLNGVYTQYVNRTHARTGHAFQGRYHAVLVERETHLLELARYVVLNPVRAGTVDDAARWPWSSYRTFVGWAAAPPWLETDWLLSQFGRERRSAVRRFVDFVRAGVGLPSVWSGLRGDIYLGSDDFVQRMQAFAERAGAGGRLSEVPRLQRRPLALPLRIYVEQNREDPKAGMIAAYATGDYTMLAVAAAFGVHYSTVSRAVRRELSRSDRNRLALPTHDSPV